MDSVEISYELGRHSGVIFITCDHDMTNDEILNDVKLQLEDEFHGLPFGIHEFNIINRTHIDE